MFKNEYCIVFNSYILYDVEVIIHFYLTFLYFCSKYEILIIFVNNFLKIIKRSFMRVQIALFD